MQQADIKKKKIPNQTGVYIFQNSKREALYIGRAKSLKSRVNSYFSADIEKKRSPLIAQMVHKAKTIKVIPTENHLDAFVLEAHLIKTNRPIYNSREKDNKSFQFVVITKEDFPRVLIVRGREIDAKYSTENTKYIFGPFPSGDIFKNAMRIIRKLFPYRDKCQPQKEGQIGKPCFRAQIGLCPGMCAGEITKKEYAKKIKNLATFFKGERVKLINQLTKQMHLYAKKEMFEEAEQTKKEITFLKHIQDVSLIRSEYISGSIKPIRIEGYDVSHTSGVKTVGVMVVVENMEPQKKEYRKFTIRSAKASDDTGALKEILTRRFKHLDWEMPNLMVLDGGKGHINTARKVLNEFDLKIPIVAVTKDSHHKPKLLQGDKISANTYKDSILLANAEAHRFVIAWHRKLRDKI